MSGQGQGVRPQLRIHHPQWRINHAACKCSAVRIQTTFGLAFVQGNVVAVLLEHISRGQASHAAADDGDVEWA